MKDSGVILLAEENGDYGIYSMLSSFFHGLKKGFENQNTNVYWATNIKGEPHLSIAFNVTGINSWQSIMESGCSQIMWTVDSCFYHNFEIVHVHQKFPDFHILGLTKADIEPLNYFFPDFKNYHYLPLAVDPNVWKYDGQEKDLDVVYLASVRDPNNIIEEVKAKIPQNLFDPFMDMFAYLKENPHANIWELYKEILLDTPIQKQQHAFVFHYFFKNLTYLISYTKRIELAKSMEDIGIKIWGNDEWTKYLSGKNQYMGAADFKDAIKVLQRAKVSLNLQPLQIFEGLHDRILNSTMTESAVLCDSVPEIKNTFGESLTYFDIKKFSDIKRKTLLLLQNEELRKYKVEKAKEIILRDHTWDSRAKTIQTIMSSTRTPV